MAKTYDWLTVTIESNASATQAQGNQVLSFKTIKENPGRKSREKTVTVTDVSDAGLKKSIKVIQNGHDVLSFDNGDEYNIDGDYDVYTITGKSNSPYLKFTTNVNSILNNRFRLGTISVQSTSSGIFMYDVYKPKTELIGETMVNKIEFTAKQSETYTISDLPSKGDPGATETYTFSVMIYLEKNLGTSDVVLGTLSVTNAETFATALNGGYKKLDASTSIKQTVADPYIWIDNKNEDYELEAFTYESNQTKAITVQSNRTWKLG